MEALLRFQGSQQGVGRSTVARLCAALLVLFREVLRILAVGSSIPKRIRISLERSHSTLVLWSNGYGVAEGDLDETFARSRRLRRSTWRTLAHISNVLTDRLIPQSLSNPPQPKLDDFTSPLKCILDEDAHALSPECDGEADDSSSDASSDFDADDLDEIAEDLKTDTQLLVELDPLFTSPVFDLGRREIAGDLRTDWAPHKVYVEKIENRFPLACRQLVDLLGKANYERSLRCQAQRDGHENEEGKQGDLSEQRASTLPESKFHDSGIGSSLPIIETYAEALMTYTNEDRSMGVPPLPREARPGKPFPCTVCGRSVTITNNSSWKRHLYHDLQPYMCIDLACNSSNRTFSTQISWIAHLALEHKMAPHWDAMTCPLCKEMVEKGKFSIITHFGRHLEEISLSALPPTVGSEATSEAGSPRDDKDGNGDDNGDDKSDDNAAPIDSPVGLSQWLSQWRSQGQYRELTMDAPLPIPTLVFANSHFKLAHYNNPNFEPEEFQPHMDEYSDQVHDRGVKPTRTQETNLTPTAIGNQASGKSAMFNGLAEHRSPPSASAEWREGELAAQDGDASVEGEQQLPTP